MIFCILADVAENVDKYFNDLIKGLESIAQELESAQIKLESEVNNLL